MGSSWSRSWRLTPLINDLRTILVNKGIQNEYILLDYPFAYLNKEMNEFIDLTIFIDTPLDVAMARRILRDYSCSNAEEIRLDMESYLSGAREAYLSMLNTVKPDSDIVIDGTYGKEEIIESIKQMIKNHLKGIH